ncbi:MAG: LysR family transcriptional regulator [Rhodobacteraceae bacterium]|nr:LysR family transcriptional regulator [Paracoccaceae bacterium]
MEQPETGPAGTATVAGMARLEWGDLAVILAIARGRGLSGAARSLGKTHSTVFRNINAIEARTGVRFFDRFSHGYAATDAARAAVAAAERIEEEVNALGVEVLGRDTRLSGRIRVTSPEAFAEDHAPGIIARFTRRHPDIQIDLSPGHGAVDLNRREAEVAIRATKAAPEASFGRRVCDFRFALYGTADCLRAMQGRPLAQCTFCLIEGIGLTFLPCYVGDADPRLERASDAIAGLDMSLWVLTHPDLQTTARVRALMSHLYEELTQNADLFSGRVKPPGRWNLLPATN